MSKKTQRRRTRKERMTKLRGHRLTQERLEVTHILETEAAKAAASQAEGGALADVAEAPPYVAPLKRPDPNGPRPEDHVPFYKSRVTPPAPVARAEARMISRAKSERWAVPEEARVDVPARLHAIANDTKASPRNVISAGRLLKEMDEVNQKQEEYDENRPQAHTIVIEDAHRSVAEAELAQWRQQQRLQITRALPPMPALPAPASTTDAPSTS